MTATPHGFWISGPISNDRRLVNASLAFAGFASCEPAGLTGGEHYLSAFTFGQEVVERVLSGTDMLDVRGYEGVCGSSWIWWDIDHEYDLDAALKDARALCLSLVDQLGVPESDVLAFFSGSKGFHIGAPTAPWQPTPSRIYHRVIRKLAEAIAGAEGVVIDTGVYDRVRPFRAPNSRHPKTGLHKRSFTVKELLAFNLQQILNAAREPVPFEVPVLARTVPALTSRWQAAEQAVAAEDVAISKRDAEIAATDGATLNRLTMEIIRTGQPLVVGNRHRLLYSAARNLAECGCPVHLAVQLLTEHGLDSGLAPKDIRRQIECGVNDNTRKSNA